ncbi:MAG: THUMP-like domain-containing protein [Planctomycetia bacterium]
MPDRLPDAAVDLWTSSRGERLLEAAHATRGMPALRRPGALAAHGTPDEVRWALQQDGWRERAAAKVPHAGRLLFTREALEQASAWPVALERAARLSLPAGARLADLCAGIGLDALAAATHGLQVVAVERDPLRARLLAWNAAALGLSGRVEVRCADVLEAAPSADAAFLDPDRRAQGTRTRDASRFAPPLEAWEGLLARYPRALVKVAPGGPSPAPTRASEVVSLDGEARERRLLWRGFEGAPAHAAVALPGGQRVAGAGAPWPAPRAPRPGDWVLDCDPALTLAGVVGEACAAHGLVPVHARIACLLGAAPAPALPGTWLEVLEVLAPSRPVLQRWVDAHGIGVLEVRCRGVADDAHDWRRRLRLAGPQAGTLLFTRDPADRWLALAVRRAARETPA